MQPENSHNVVPGIENMPMPPTTGPEQVPVLPPIDASFERGHERVEQMAEAGAIAGDAAAMASPAAVVAPLITQPQAVSPPAEISGTGPLVAGDEDLIEKEWVDKSKQIIEVTKDDPYTRAEKVNELKADYQQKRFGKVLKND